MSAIRSLIRLVLIAIVFGNAGAQSHNLTVDDLYHPIRSINFSGEVPYALQWCDADHYLQLDKANEQLLKTAIATAHSTPLFVKADLLKALAHVGINANIVQEAFSSGDYQLAPDRRALLLHYQSDLYYYNAATRLVTRLTHDAAAEKVARFSPDGKWVCFVRDYDLYLVEIASKRVRRLTEGGSSALRFGYLDWVYQEELYGRGNFKGYWWSPDSRKIAFLQLDCAAVKQFAIVNHIPYRAAPEIMKYPKAGEPNPRAWLGIIDIASGKLQWIDNTRYQNAPHLIVRVGWSPDSKQVVYQLQNREQTWLHLNFADSVTGKSQIIIKESAHTWVEIHDNPYWLRDGSFLWLSERSGWKHLYHYHFDGRIVRQITKGKWEIRELYGVDEKNGWIYFAATRDSAVERHIYRVKRNGHDLQRLSSRPGTHYPRFNPGCSHYFDFWSDIATPVQVHLFTAAGKLVRVISANKVEALARYRLARPQFLQVKARDGFVMEALMFKPPNFDPGKKYPVLCHVYSGPHAPEARNSWAAKDYLWHQLLAQRGYIVWVCDNRTASGKGICSAWPLFHNFGQCELRDIEDGVDWLRQQKYVASDRIGIWGWSFGGYMTCYALTHSQSFKIGIAVAPVTDWHNYDSIYTERYMGLPGKNKRGYRQSSAVVAAKNLHGKLLLVHGTMDDNVHLQNTLQFAYALQKAGKQFTLMLYPESRHGIGSRVLRHHLYQMMTNFVLKNL